MQQKWWISIPLCWVKILRLRKIAYDSIYMKFMNSKNICMANNHNSDNPHGQVGDSCWSSDMKSTVVKSVSSFGWLVALMFTVVKFCRMLKILHFIAHELKLNKWWCKKYRHDKQWLVLFLWILSIYCLTELLDCVIVL